LHIKKNKIRVLTYHGNNRLKSNREIKSYDVVITNYDSLASDFKALDDSKKKIKTSGNLLNISWFRVVLDEAHVIRNINTQVTKAILQLTTRYRWCLTGTPMPNGIKDLESLFLFLGVAPFVNEKIEGTTVSRESNGYFQRYIVRELKAGHGVALVHLKMLMRAFALKRTKSLIAKFIPEKIEQIVYVKLNDAEQESYSAIQNVISDYVARQSLDDYSTVLGFLTRLRQACLDIRLVPPDALVRLLATAKNSPSSISTGPTLSKKEQEDLLKHLEAIFSVARAGAAVAVDDNEGFENVECCICLEPFSEDNSVIFRTCKHTICSTCDTNFFKDGIPKPCPYCRAMINPKKDRINHDILMRELEASAKSSKATNRNPVDTDHNSSKTKAVIDMLKKTGDDKVAIFSQFVGYLDFLHVALVREGFKVVQITGQLAQKQRTNVLLKFSTDPKVKIILCSTKACGVGINLVAANHVYLTDMWWSPAVDHQAIDRVHRLGQKKNVSVCRFVVQNSIDEKIIEIQKKKILQTKTLLDAGKERTREEKQADLAYLLGV
jgi:SWI/SNF-related matrix-associated actin-dependent regulator of chromatin subfamily A3